MSGEHKHWNVTRTVTLGASAKDVWDVIGGFFTIHEWHPDISRTDISEEQTSTRRIRRILTFPGQAPTVEELVSMDDADFHYRYKWFDGPWGEEVKNYRASLRILAGDLDETCTVQWASSFDHPDDAISAFYHRGFAELSSRFPLPDQE